MIVLGADVGKATGLALLDCSGARPRFLDSAVIRDDLVGALSLRFFGAHVVDLVGIETPSQVFEHGRAAENEGARRSIERALLVARDAAGQVRAIAGMRGVEVHDGQAHHVRRAVLGKLPREHLDRFIAGRLPLLVEGWPATSNTHQRDAAIVALWAWQRARAGLRPGDASPKAKGKRGRPTVGDLHAAAERVLGRPRASDGCHERPELVRALDQLGRGPEPVPSRRALEREGGSFSRDPGAEQAACMLVPCEVCGARPGIVCAETGRRVYGVHMARAAAAGIAVKFTVDAKGVDKIRAFGARKLAAKASLEAWAVLPWRTCKGCGGSGLCGVLGFAPDACTACKGVGFEPVRWPALDGAGPAREAWMTVPASRQAEHGVRIRMTRREWSRAGKTCWLYQPAE